MKRTIFYILAFALCSCAVQRTTTSEEFVRDIQKDLPFKVSGLKAVSGHDNTYSFRSDGYIGLLSSGATSSSTAKRSVSSVSTASSKTAGLSAMSMCCNRKRRVTATPAPSIGM